MIFLFSPAFLALWGAACGNLRPWARLRGHPKCTAFSAPSIVLAFRKCCCVGGTRPRKMCRTNRFLIVSFACFHEAGLSTTDSHPLVRAAACVTRLEKLKGFKSAWRWQSILVRALMQVHHPPALWLRNHLHRGQNDPKTWIVATQHTAMLVLKRLKSALASPVTLSDMKEFVLLPLKLSLCTFSICFCAKMAC